jgi:hypothetical protein
VQASQGRIDQVAADDLLAGLDIEQVAVAVPVHTAAAGTPTADGLKLPASWAASQATS